jgi:hypothetical protein
MPTVMQQLLTHKLSQATLNARLNEAMTVAAGSRLTAQWLDFVQQQLPALTTQREAVAGRLDWDDDPSGLPGNASITAGGVRLNISRAFGIRLFYNDRQITTDRANIPFDYPWFQPDPADPEDVAGYAARHVSRGSRGESPWPESQWPLVGGVCQGDQHWPARDAAFGPYRLQLIGEGEQPVILLTLPSDRGTNAYGVIPKGLFTVLADTSVVLSLQLHNQSPLNLSWAPWLVLGVAMPPEGTMNDPSAIFAFPDDMSRDPLAERIHKTWNYTEISCQRLALINPHAKTLNEPFKKYYRDTNWSMVAMKSADAILLTRSVLRHNEQFFPFLEHGRHFIEAEHTGPRVQTGHKSSVLVKQEFLPVRSLTQGTIATLSNVKGEFEAQVRLILNTLVDWQHQGRLVANYPG